MSKITNSKVDEKNKKIERDVCFDYAGFQNSFSKKKLRQLYEEEDKKLSEMGLEKQLRKKKEMSKELIEKWFPKTIKYLSDNIFRNLKSEVFVKTVNPITKQLIPQQFTPDEFKSIMDSFEPEIKVWWQKHNLDDVQIIWNMDKPQIFNDEEGRTNVNLFTGFRFRPMFDFEIIKGQRKIKQKLPKTPEEINLLNEYKLDIQFYWNHLNQQWCKNNKQQFNYLKNYICANIGGRRKMTTSPYLKGVQGIGKTIPITCLSEIVGVQNTCNLTNTDSLTGTFNGIMLGKIMVIFSELKMENVKEKTKFYNLVKPWVTDPWLVFRDLYKSALQLSNNITLWFVGNSHCIVMEADSEDRRLFVLDLSDEVPNAEYLSKLKGICDDPEFQHALYLDCCDNYDENWNEQLELKKLPMSDTKKEMNKFKMNCQQKYLASQFDDPKWWVNVHKKMDLWRHYKRFCEDRDARPVDYESFMKELLDKKDYKKCVEVCDARINGQHYKDVIRFNGKEMFLLFYKMGFIGKHELRNEEIIHPDFQAFIKEETPKKLCDCVECQYFQSEAQAFVKDNEARQQKRVKNQQFLAYIDLKFAEMKKTKQAKQTEAWQDSEVQKWFKTYNGRKENRRSDYLQQPTQRFDITKRIDCPKKQPSTKVTENLVQATETVDALFDRLTLLSKLNIPLPTMEDSEKSEEDENVIHLQLKDTSHIPLIRKTFTAKDFTIDFDA